jgi:hypothetical protein
MLKNNSYNIDRHFDYTAVRSIVLKSLEKIANEQVLKNSRNGVIFDFKDNDDHPANVNNLLAPPTPPLLNLKIRNTTKYLNWGLSILLYYQKPITPLYQYS